MTGLVKEGIALGYRDFFWDFECYYSSFSIVKILVLMYSKFDQYNNTTQVVPVNHCDRY
jgi:hypothetical protein